MTPGLQPADAYEEPGRPGHAVGLQEPHPGRPQDPSSLLALRRDLDARNLPVAGVAACIKADMRQRFSQGDRRAVSGYLEVFPELGEFNDLILSLVYEEYCLREEGGENPDPDSFCDRYAPWRDSIASQLRYHRPLSLAVGGPVHKPQFPALGGEFCRYRLRSVLGEGGWARVYLANQPNLPDDCYVALKVSLDRGSEPSILARLEHDHIVPILSVSVDSETGMRGLCMPYSPGLTLDKFTSQLRGATKAADIRHVVNRARGEFDSTVALMPMSSPAVPGAAVEGAEVSPVGSRSGDARRRSWDEYPDQGTYAEGVAWIGLKIAEALAYAHRMNVLHLDVKPANILLTGRNGPRLLDFNLSHDPHAPVGAEAALRGGTLPYMAPEQLRAFLDPDRWGDVGPRADLYSLGLVLTDLLTGRLPDKLASDLPLPRAIAEMCDLRLLPPASARATTPSIPRSLDLILSHCLAPQPKDRYADGDQLAEDLRRFLANRPLLHARPPTLVDRTSIFLERTRTKCLFAAALTLLVGLLLLARFTAPPPPLTERTEFRQAVKDLYAKKELKALATFKSLQPEHVDSPLLNFYLGFAHERNNEWPVSERHYAIAFRPQGPPAEFLREKVLNPLLGESIGQQAEVIQSLLGDPSRARRQEFIPLCIKAFSYAVHLDESQPKVHSNLAKVYDLNGQYQETLEHLDRAIKLTITDGTRIELALLYLRRANARMKLAEQLIGSDSETARTFLMAALEDLALIRVLDLKESGDVFLYESYFPAHIRARLGDIDRLEGRPDAAADRYLAAEGILIPAVKRFPRNKAATALQAEVQGRLKELGARTPAASSPAT
jgi:serine/threonine protein kinase